jgi:hypothetical protein
MRKAIFRWSSLVLVALLAGVCAAQDSTKRNDRPKSQAAPTPVSKSTSNPNTHYRWEFAQPQFVVKHIVIEHDALGRGKVSFDRKAEVETIVESIELSQSVIERLEKLWRALNFIDSKESYQASKNFAHLGTYKLGMNDGAHERITEFNWSDNSDAWNLAQEYRRVADQAILLFDINIARENQPLNTPGLLTQMESMYTRNALSDPKQLVPLLKELRTDEHIPLIARNHADRLLKKFEK